MSHASEDPNNTTFCTLAVHTDGRHITLVEDLRGQVCRRIVDTQEQMIRQTLISLGWSPPERTQELHNALAKVYLEARLSMDDDMQDFIESLQEILNRRPT